MELVIAERSFAQSVSPALLREVDGAAGWCFDRYRCHPGFHLLALDGMRQCSVFSAPDAEAVRQTAQSSGSEPPEKVWTAGLEGATGGLDDLRTRALEAEKSGSLALVERSFPAPVVFAEVQTLEDKGSWCLDLNGISFLATFFARDRQRMICLYKAPDSEAVRRTNTRLELPFDRVWPARVVAAD